MASVRWTDRAVDDLREIHEFISRDSPRAAARLIESILDATERLATFPESGRAVPELPGSVYRELLIQSYRVQYRIHHEVVWIMTVLHGRRQPSE